MDLTNLSNAPPHQGARSTLNSQSVPNPARYSLTVPSLKTDLRYLDAALNVFPLSDMNLAGKPLLAENLFCGLVWNSFQVNGSRYIAGKETNPDFLRDILSATNIDRSSEINAGICEGWVILHPFWWKSMSFMQVEELLWQLDWPDVAIRTCLGIPRAREY